MRELSKILLSMGAVLPINPEGYSGPGAIHLAAQGGHKGMLRLMLSKVPGDYYVDARIRPDQDISSTHVWMGNAHVQRQYSVMESGFNPSAKLEGGSALALAARTGRIEVIASLLDAGEAVTVCHLLNAATSGSVPAMSLLLDRVADVQANSASGGTPLHAAVVHNHPEVVRFLLETGAKIEATDCYGNTALCLAIRCDHLECLQLLLEYIADIGFRSEVKLITERQACQVP
ncbi:hypothetical protein AJ79_03193 [Helicocarpus griseus UAMH5409]|uniref:Uncharacterized protein n=1 Tax=Helicocarpus griseus UAMH5409 TaxID=1447875 RepID=A0A2B7XYX1_9EURO|nr:hypothetical protein AJ79_03193 [Helicocarpus griseus UAMH5409]